MKYQSALSLPAMAACLVLLGPNVAAARSAAKTPDSTNMHASAAARSEAMKMVPAQADLTRELNAKKLHDGQTFEAKLADKVKLTDGPTLPKGTELEGKVVKDQMSASGGHSTLTLRFTQADLKNGKKVPIKATIVGLYSGANQSGVSALPTQTPNYWTPKTLQVDQINALHNVDLHSRIAAQNSGVLQSSKSNIRFAPGTEFALAISGRGSQS